MEPTDDELELTRWIDGELSEEEAERLLRENPDWPEKAEAASLLGDSLRKELPQPEEPPYADFFNHQIRRRIEGNDVFAREGAIAAPGPQEAEAPGGISLFGRLRWLAGAGFLGVASILVFFVASQSPSFDRTEIVNLYTPVAGVSASTLYHDEAAATVVHLEGLADVAPSTAYLPASSRVPKEGGPVFYRFESPAIGRPVSVLSQNDANPMPRAILVGF